MPYIEGFVAAVPTVNKEAYRKHAQEAGAYFKKLGATRLVECWGDDVPKGALTDFYKATQAKDDETPVFSWVEYPDKATRDAANARMRADPRMEEMGKDMPFDGMRMIYGGFETLVAEGPAGGGTYLDGSVAPARATSKDTYRAHSERVTKKLLEAGALRCVEAWEDDIDDGKVTDFRRAVNSRADEKIVFSWVEWPSRAVRDAAWAQIMADPSLAPNEDEAGAVDNRRRIFGGFVPILDQ